MTPHFGESIDRNPALLLARAGWLNVSDRILSGACHDLNGRLSSLDGLAQLLTLDGAEGTPVIPYLKEEISKLETVVSLLRLFPGDLMAVPEPMTPTDLVDDVVRLHRKHRGLESQATTYSCEDGLPPVLVNRARVGRGLLILMAWIGRTALDSGAGSLEIRAEAEGEAVTLRLEGKDAGNGTLDLGVDAAAPEVAALRDLLRLDGGELDIEDRLIAVRLPSLAEARRRK